MAPDYVSRIDALHRALGIPADYASTRGLRLHPEAAASELIAVATTREGREILLTRETAAAWRRLESAAADDGLGLVAVSGFRSVQRQVEILQRKLAAGTALQEILRVNAAPGYSEHHTGCALDLGGPGEPPLTEAFGDTAAFAWLMRRAGDFGFSLSYPRGHPSGITYEPWHWCWRGA
jgi:zinc D-Ala-D-Ala carboxypeptidase